MGKPRVRGQHVTIEVKTTDGKKIVVGEVTKLSVKELGELKKNRGLGEAQITANKTFEGYDLSFEGGLVDWNLAALLHKQDQAIYGDSNDFGQRAPYFQVIQKINYFGTNLVTTNTYPDVIFHGYNLDSDSMDESMQKWEGFCGTIKNREDSGVTIPENQTANAVQAMIAATLARDEENTLFY